MEEKVHRKSSMIYITGDTHGYFTRFSAKRLRKAGMELTQEDYIIICGDFGLCWAEDKTLSIIVKILRRNLTPFCRVQGNHENYDMIGEYPLEEWHGGKAGGPGLPTEENWEGLRNLERYHYEVDYVITHCCASTLQDRINAGTGRSCAPDLLTDYLGTLEQKLHYRHWYFGHYHRDCQPDDKHTLVYYAILPLEQKESASAVPVPDQTEGEMDHGKG